MMTCQEVRAQLPDYWAQNLVESTQAAVAAHLGVCRDCQADTALWAKLGALPEEKPSPALRARFDAMLETYHDEPAPSAPPARGRQRLGDGLGPAWLRLYVLPFAWAALFLVVGFAAGYFFNRRHADNRELARLHEEIYGMRQLVVLSLLQQQSASERLRGVNWSYRIGRPDHEILSALLHTLKYDPSVDVRLAAIDALCQFSQDRLVRQGFIEALSRQESPLVQIALIDLMVELREHQSVEVLRRLKQDQQADETVRQRADWALQQLS